MFSLDPKLVPLLVLTLAVCGMISVANTSKKDPAHDVNTKRDAPEEGTKFIETDIRGLAHAVHAYLSQSHDRGKRSIDNTTVPWATEIPIIFGSTYSDPFYQNMVLRVARYISNKTCLTIVDETSRWDPTNTKWFTQNGYKWESYIKVSTGADCSTTGQSPKNGSYIETRPCFDSDLIMHEFFHALGAPHEQQSFIADRYINVFIDTVIPKYRYTYDASSPNILTNYFDSSSTMLYSDGTWSMIADHTIVPIRPDQGKPDESTSSEDIMFQQLNQRHKCAEVFCPGVSTDCGPGYLSRINKVCKCVCPPEYDPGQNCKSVINQADTTVTWDIPLYLLAGGENFTCPAGFNPTGWFSFCGTLANGQGPSPAPFPNVNKTVYIPICAKQSPTTTIDWNSVPIGGRYCFGKASGVTCGGVFTEATVEFQSSCVPQFNGTLGDITIKSNNNITMKLCCSNHENVNFVAVLPNQTPFRMFTIYNCPYVQGMRTYSHYLTLYTAVRDVYGGPNLPAVTKGSNYLNMNLCYFQPALYGCSQSVNLTSTNRNVTLNTPGYPQSRPANTRCFYCFNAPEGSKLRVTFTVYDLEKDDKIRIKRYNKWGDWFRLDNGNPWMQFVTETNYLCMEFWSGYLKVVTNKGASFTVELLLDSESCYDETQKGINYLGTTNVSETYEACLDWKDTHDCSDSPANAQEALTGYFEKNYCRNPGGKLLQPWCYTYKNSTSCIKRYCDVCNTKQPVDAIKTTDCIAAMNADPSFCQTALQRFGCFKSCGMAQALTNSTGSCTTPPVPQDGNLVGSAKSSYQSGERAYVKCKGISGADNDTLALLCAKGSWNVPTSACIDCPLGWTPNGDRCVYYSAKTQTRPVALAFCRSYNRNGTLMQIKSAADVTLMRGMRTKANTLVDHSWFGAYLCNATTSTWCLLDTTTIMTYTNWNSDAYINDPRYSTAYMYRETSSSNKGGKWYEISVNDTTSLFTYFCQVDRLNAGVVTDKYSTCQSALTENPTSCVDPRTTQEAQIYCAKSCGLSSGTPQCVESTSSSYKRTSIVSPVNTGDFMTFECNSGYFLNGGDTKRACGLNGSLLGTAPDCISNPSSLNVGVGLVLPRFYTLSGRLAIVMDADGYRVPITGKITTWYYYCENPGLVYFLVYRKNGTSYTLIGYNSQTCIAHWRWGFNVPTANQTAVLAGDLVGAWSPVSNTISTTECDGASIKLLNVQSQRYDTFDLLQSATSFPTQICLMAAIGYRVEKTW